MKLKKIIALSMTAALTVSSLIGCGSVDKEENKESTNKSEKTVGAESFSDALEKGSNIETYMMDGKIAFSVKADELFSDEYVGAMLDVFGIEGNELKGNITFDHKINESGAYQSSVGLEFGNINADITELIYIDDTLYVNVKMLCDFVETVAETMDLGSEVKTYLQLLPEGDYIAVTSEMMKQFATQMLTMGLGASMGDLEGMIEEAQDTISTRQAEEEKALFYLIKEVEKIAKKGENSYSEKNGYTITINNDNAVSLLKAFVDVFAEDGEEILKNIEVLTGDLGVTAEDMKENMGMGSPEEIEAMLKDAESVKNSAQKMSAELFANYTGEEGKGVFDFRMDVSVKDSEMEMGMEYQMKVKEEKDIKITAPESVMAQEDVDALLEMFNGTALYDDSYDFVA